MVSNKLSVQSLVQTSRSVPVSRVVSVRTRVPGYVSFKVASSDLKSNNSLDFLLASVRGGERLVTNEPATALLSFYDEREKLLTGTQQNKTNSFSFNSELIGRHSDSNGAHTFQIYENGANPFSLNSRVSNKKSEGYSFVSQNTFISRRLTIRRSRLRHFGRIKSKRDSRTKSFFGSYNTVATKFSGEISEFSSPAEIKKESTIVAYTSSVPNRSGSAGYNVSTYNTITDLTRLLSYFIGAPVNLTRIPAFSFTRYAFDLEALELAARSGRTINGINSGKNIYLFQPLVRTPGMKGASRFLTQRERERGSRYTSVAVYLPDLLRITFVSRYRKTATVLAQFLALSLADLPRTRKETQFLRFLIKVVKVFAAQRKEILGVRIQRDGRVNRWRRTKRISGTKGHLPFHTYDARREIGIGQAITKKGTIGIRLWFCYHPSFARTFRVALLSYVRSRSLNCK